MITLFLSVCLCAFDITFINAEARTFHYRNMCIPKQRVKNCSFQISTSHSNSCLIYNTDACKKNEFPPWSLESLNKPTLESDSELTVVIEPFAFYIEDLQKNDPVSAINISLTSFSRNITGFSIIMNRNAPPKNICRVIDFRNSFDVIKIPFQFYYDCLVMLREDHWKNPLITFKAYPLNIDLTYLVYIPRVSGETSNSSCDWTPLLMIYHEALSRNHIQLKFSNPQNDSNILFFVINLLDSSDVDVGKARIPSNIKNDMIFWEFKSVKSGFYSVAVSVILPQRSCLVFKSDLFLVGSTPKDYALVIFIVLVIIVVISAFVLTYYLCQRYLTSVTSILKPSLLLVYFPKQSQHEFLVMWAKYLEKHHGVNTYTLYKRGGNPKIWLDDIFSKSNIIVFVLSEGLAQAYDEEITSCEEDHYWVEQLPEAKALINSLKVGEKVFCKVCFPFSKKQHVPKCLKRNGPLFKLLGKVDETEKFLCYIFNCSSKFRFLNRLCCIKHHVVENADSMQKDLKDLKDKLKKININNNVNSDIDINEGNLQVNKPLDLIFKNDNQGSSNITDGNEDILATNIPTFESKIFHLNKDGNNSSFSNIESNLMPCSSIEDCDDKNVIFRQQGENMSYLNDEFLKYCLRKAINYE